METFCEFKPSRKSAARNDTIGCGKQAALVVRVRCRCHHGDCCLFVFTQGDREQDRGRSPRGECRPSCSEAITIKISMLPLMAEFGLLSRKKAFSYFHFTSSSASTSFRAQPAPASAGEESEEDQQFRTIFQEIAGDVSMRKRERVINHVIILQLRVLLLHVHRSPSAGHGNHSQ